MKTKIFFITLLFSMNMMGQNMTSTEFWQEDKIKHSAVSFGISTATYTYLSVHKKHKKLPEIKKRLISLSTTIIAGALKEMVDSSLSGHHASWGDMGANAAGALAFQAAITVPVNFTTKRKRKRGEQL